MNPLFLSVSILIFIFLVLSISFIKIKSKQELNKTIFNSYPSESTGIPYNKNIPFIFSNLIMVIMLGVGLIIFSHYSNIENQYSSFKDITTLYSFIGFISIFSYLLLLFIPLLFIRAHILLYFLNLLTSVSASFISSFYMYFLYKNDEKIVFLIFAICLFVFVIFTLFMALKSAFIKKRKYNETNTYSRPKFVSLAFSEWLNIILINISIIASLVSLLLR